MRSMFRICVAAAAALSLAGCGIVFPSAHSRASRNTPGFKAGYTDGCASATIQDTNYRADTVRDEQSYASDKNYRAGWSSGFTNCRTNLTHDTTIPGGGPIPDNNPGAQRH